MWSALVGLEGSRAAAVSHSDGTWSRMICDNAVLVRFCTWTVHVACVQYI